jgi:hypothetical protein
LRSLPLLERLYLADKQKPSDRVVCNSRVPVAGPTAEKCERVAWSGAALQKNSALLPPGNIANSNTLAN